MLTKFETKSGRVKGLSFHSKLPWILASLHNGVIQLWDYRMGTLVDRFLDHDGPVRAVHFHKSQPLFVSGGDDYKVKVWNYKLRRCLFTLTGHQDYVRTVEFHHEYPWIVSASDDQTIRIWNWQSRTCVSVLTGHSHYVMCASFHPKDDLLVSASFDQTIRVWDISALRQKPASPPDDDIMSLFGVDAVVIYVLEGHNRGVNWVSFHPTWPLIFSCGDDRRVKIWRMNETKASEVGTLSGHMNNVSCVLYLARQDVIVSNSEDKTIRVWDATKREPLQTFSRENDRFWILTAHPEMNLLAAGHDSGMVVFKLERERPAFSATNDNLLYVKGRFLRAFEYSTQKDIQLIPIRRPGSNTVNQSPPRTLSYSPTENAVLISSDMDGGSYELHIVPKNGSDAVQDPKKGSGSSAVFVARNRFAVLEKSCNQVVVKNLQNSTVKESDLPIPTDAITYAGTGKVLCRAEQEVIIFDLQQRIVLGELQVPSIRHVVWSHDMESVALLSKHFVVIADKKLARRCTLREIVRVKSGAWDNNGVFIYTTLTQIKYCLPNGDSGTIKTLDFPVYITKIVGDTIFCLDRNGKNRPIIIDSTEYILKLCLLRKDYDQVMKMINSSQLCGQAVIAYLQQKGFPEAALHFVKDERTRFNLALECGNIQIAVASAKEMDEEDHWYRLGVEALRQGNVGIAEYAYLRTRSFGRLSFLYLIAGNLEKLSKMMKIAKGNDDFMDQFHGSLYTGNKEESVRILQNAGLSPLAYITATVHGLGEAAERIAAELKEEAPCLPNGKTASLLAPPKPVLSGGDWPLLTLTRGIFHGLENAAPGEYEEEDADWAENMQISGDDEEVHEEEGGWDIEDLDLPADDLDTASSSSSSVFVAPARGIPASQIRVQKSSLAGEHAAAGNFDTAMSLLNRQLGITNFTPLKKLFIDLHSASHSYLHPFPSAPVFTAAVERGWGTAWLGFPQLEEKRDAGYKATTDGNFPDAIKTFLSILHAIPLTVVETQSEVEEVEKLITIARDYVLGLQMEVKRKQSMPIRQLELAAYFTHTNNLLPHHQRLTLWNAMSLAYKAKRMSLAANFASRFLDTNPTDENKAGNARKVVEAAERVHHDDMRDDDELNYDFRHPFVVCGATYVPIYRGQNDVACPYCSAHFVPAQQGQLCNVCHLAAVGARASGLLCSPSQVR